MHIAKWSNKMRDVNVSDVVRLHSGGPAMTVESMNGDDITCVWFVDEIRQTALFKRSNLRKVTVGQFKATSGHRY